MFYTVWVEKDGQQSPYVFKADMYWAIEEDATEVPYSFNYGSWDGNHNIYFQDGVEEGRRSVSRVYIMVAVRATSLPWFGWILQPASQISSQMSKLRSLGVR